MVEFREKMYNKLKRTINKVNDEIIYDISIRYNIPINELNQFLEDDNNIEKLKLKKSKK